MKYKNGDMRVLWFVPIDSPPFIIDVKSVEEAIIVMNVLSSYDSFQQLINNTKPFYSNVGDLEIFDDGEWNTWINENGEHIEDLVDK